MKNIVIFDLDGTIALIDERRKLSTKSNDKINWDTFFSPKYIDLDKPNLAVIKILRALKMSSFKVIILSGRLETAKNATLQWLKKNDIKFDEIRMRENTTKGKYISDVELKEDWLNDIGKENVMCVFDDRTKLVEMWRRNGVDKNANYHPDSLYEQLKVKYL